MQISNALKKQALELAYKKEAEYRAISHQEDLARWESNGYPYDLDTNGNKRFYRISDDPAGGGWIDPYTGLPVKDGPVKVYLRCISSVPDIDEFYDYALKELQEAQKVQE